MNNLPLNQRTQINIPEAVDSVFTAYAKSGRLYAPDISNRAVIDANPEVWQEFVLNALTIADSDHEAGSFRLKSIIAGGSDLTQVAHILAPNTDQFDDNQFYPTTRAIPIMRVLSILFDYYEYHGIKCIIAEDEEYLNAGKPCFENLVLEYLNYLVEKRYLINLNTRIGHYEEASYRLASSVIQADKDAVAHITLVSSINGIKGLIDIESSLLSVEDTKNFKY